MKGYSYDFITTKAEAAQLARHGFGKLGDAGTPWGVRPCLHARGKVAAALREYNLNRSAYVKRGISAYAFVRASVARQRATEAAPARRTRQAR